MSKDTQVINILQYNTNKSGNQVQTPFMQQMDPETHHIIAIQEPWLNPTSQGRVKTFPGYHTVQPQGEVPRVTIYMSKVIPNDSWEAQFFSNDLVGIRMQQGDKRLQVLNCYNPSSSISDRNPGTLPLVREALQTHPEDQCILLGDFNLHHQRWGAATATNQHWNSDLLIEITEQRGLQLFLEPGTITWEKDRSVQTLDLVFGTTDIQNQLTQCRVCEELETGSDHLPIWTSFFTKELQRRENNPRPQWKKAPWEYIRGEIEKLCTQSQQKPMESESDLDSWAKWIQEQIQDMIQTHVPHAKPSMYAKMS